MARPTQPGSLVGDGRRRRETIAPHTEADPVAILAQLLVGAGALIGRRAWFEVEATRHHPNEFVVLVGDTAKARKGSSWDHVARTLARADGAFTGRVRTGLSTGEGLIWAAPDPDGADPGVADPRLLVVEPEFVTVLKATGRDINTLSPVLRAAWDGRPLALLTRTAPTRASNAHIAVIGHITAAELAHHASVLEAANGFLNRFCFIACRRTRLLPEGGDPDPLAGTGIEARLGAHLAAARRAGQIHLTPAARLAWHDAYTRLSQIDDSPAGALCARAEAHALRLALLYALIDGDTTIGLAHLHAGLALWDYAARSAAWALRTTSADPIAEQIHAALTASPAGLTRTQLRDLYGKPARRPHRRRPHHPRHQRPRPTPPHHHRRPPRRSLARRTPQPRRAPLSRGQGRPRQGRPAGTAAKRRALKAEPNRVATTIHHARQPCWRAYKAPGLPPPTTTSVVPSSTTQTISINVAHTIIERVRQQPVRDVDVDDLAALRLRHHALGVPDRSNRAGPDRRRRTPEAARRRR